MKTTPPKTPDVYAPPTPKVSKQTRGRTMSEAEKAAFLASRPDLTKKV